MYITLLIFYTYANYIDAYQINIRLSLTVITAPPIKQQKPLCVNSCTQTSTVLPTSSSTIPNTSPKRHTIATPPGVPSTHATTSATVSPRHRLAGTSETPCRAKQHPRHVVMADMEPPRRVQSVDDNDRGVDVMDAPATSGLPAPQRSTSLHHSLTAHLPSAQHPHVPQHPHHPQQQHVHPHQQRDASASCHARLDQCLAQDQLSEAISMASSVGEEKALFDRLLQSNRLSGGGLGTPSRLNPGIEDGVDGIHGVHGCSQSLTSGTITSCSSSSSTLSGNVNEPLVIVEDGDRDYDDRGHDHRGHGGDRGYDLDRPLLGKQVSNGRPVGLMGTT